MVTEYYACLSRQIMEIDGQERTGLEFEIVAKEDLSFFLDGKETDSMKKKPCCEEVYQKFLKYGVTDPRFQEVKCNYLGATGYWLASVYFENIEWAQYIYENWYLLLLSDTEGELGEDALACALYGAGEIDDPTINRYGMIQILPEAQAKMLRQLYHPYIPEVQKKKAGGAGSLRALNVQTIFRKVDFLYVGAALHTEIFDKNNNLTAIFDLGTKVSSNPLLQDLNPFAQQSKEHIVDILKNINENNPMTIFISHWHVDHVNALGIIEEQVLNKLCQNTEWYVPADGTPTFKMIKNKVPAGSFHAMEQGKEFLVDVVNNPNIKVGKINLKDYPYPHHQGVYGLVCLASGKYVFLSGDTTYEGIPVDIRQNGFDFLQVCHHGGDYYLFPANQDPVIARTAIPTANEGACAIYSADGIHYGHPDPRYMNDHRNQGYLEENELQLHAIVVGRTQYIFEVL